ncbi:hypothetical protein [Streptomyces sp. NPDC047999]|uniref:hypothetical protein n=1 Tax=Streptomyces sp. NPDC047999 TaxID=3365497 RepID=UPI003723378A
MLEPRPVTLRGAPVTFGPVLTERDNRARLCPAATSVPPARSPHPTGEFPPKARNLPRRSGY